MNTNLLILLAAVVGIGFLFLYLYFVFLQLEEITKKEHEGFATTSLQIRFCPLTAPVVQTAKGNTDCCEGDLLDGKCKGNVICTQSPSHDSIPTCPDYWKDYFAKKSRDLCPPSMTNYYEDVKSTSAPKGCSASPPVADGTGPSDPSVPSCRVYNTTDENKENPDSCHIQKLKEKVRCPILSDAKDTQIKIANSYTNKFGFFYCLYTSNSGIPSFCGDDKSYTTYLDKVIPNWRTSASASQTLESMCSNFLDARNTNSREAQKKRLEDERRRREAAEKALKDAQDQNAKLQSQWQAAVNDAKSCKR